VPGLGLISAGMDANIAIVDLERLEKIRVLSGHRRGILSTAYCKEYRTLFSGSFDGQVGPIFGVADSGANSFHPQVLAWDPYCSTPVGKLQAQHNDLIEVIQNESKNQVITVCADKKIRVRILCLVHREMCGL